MRAVSSRRRVATVHAALLVAATLGTAAGATIKRSSLDPSFGSGGKVLTDFSDGSGDVALAIAVQRNGKILAAGGSGGGASGPSASAFALARYTVDGRLESSFGDGGTVLTPFGILDAYIAALTLQPNGKIVAAGQAFGDNADFALARYNRDGSLDVSFGDDGTVLNDFGGSEDAIAIALRTGNQIIVAGNSDGDFALACYNADGSLDSSFGSDGKVRTDFGGFDERAYAMALERKGRKIVVVGASSADFALARYNTDGSLDPTFGTDGLVLTDVGAAGGDDAATAVAIQPDGSIIVAGVSTGRFGLDPLTFVVVRYTTDGTLDSTFGDGGVVRTDFGRGESGTARAVAVRPDGKIVAAGQAPGLSWDFAIAVYNADGSLDSTFGNGGTLLTDFASSANSTQTCTVDETRPRPCRDDQAFAVALERNSTFVAAGLSDGDFALARYELQSSKH